jgi:hypothetical protein
MIHNRKRRLLAEPLETRRMFAVADFMLTDLNTTSDRFQDSVSPRDYMGQVSGWYFGHST